MTERAGVSWRGPSAACGGSEAAHDLTTWERWWSAADRWGPYGLLAISVFASVANPERSGAERLTILALAGLAVAWLGSLHTFAGTARREHPWHAALYLAGFLAIATALMGQDIIFFVFTITGYLHAALLGPGALVFLGTGATSFVINLMTWGGFPRTMEDTVAFVTLTALQTVLIGGGIVGSERLTQLSEERRRNVERLEATLAENEGLHAQLVTQAREAGIVDERQRLAREIHDTLAQGLTGIITQLEAADQSLNDLPELRRHLTAAADLARDSLDEARRSVHALGPGALERGRLVDALAELTDEWTERTGVSVDLAADDSGPPLSAQAEVGLLRVAQEALTNVAKHADASRVGVTLSRLDDQVVLDVRDDGHGFDPTGVANDNGSFGLTSMRQRVEELGGMLTLESQAGAGTAVSAAIPLHLRPNEGER